MFNVCFAQLKLVTIMAGRNVDKICENKMLVDHKPFKIFECAEKSLYN